MNKQKEEKQFNRKLLITFLIMLSIFITLLVTRTQAVFHVSTEIESKEQEPRKENTHLTLKDLVDYYDIFCCQFGTALPSEAQVTLSGYHSKGRFYYNMGNWEELGYSKGSQIEKHNSDVNDFNQSLYSHKTYGYYSIVENHIATPKEAYIIAEMKKELEIGASKISTDVVYENGNVKVYTGSLSNSIMVKLSTDKTAYIVNQKYVLKTDDGKGYYVTPARDSEGNLYYVYETNNDGSLVKYNGNYSYKNPSTGVDEKCIGVSVDNIYYSYNGKISSGNTVAASSGTLYLIDYDIVAEFEDAPAYLIDEEGNSYVQIAWWTTNMGTSHNSLTPHIPNGLAEEAKAFEAYILGMTDKTSVKDLEYETQNYDFIEDDGTHSVGSVKAPVIDYKPGFNEDADLNGVINEADEVTVSFDYEKQKYIVGPFSLNYKLDGVKVNGREEVDFAEIEGAKLISNLGELEYGKQWDYIFTRGEGYVLRPEEEVKIPNILNYYYKFPKPNEVFYIEINYIDQLTRIEEFSFDFKYMNAGAELNIYDGNYNVVTWKSENSGGESSLKCTSIVPKDSQTLAHALIGTRWYNKLSAKRSFEIMPATITIEKYTYNKEGTEIVPINKAFHFKLFINDKEFQELTVKTRNGYGKVTSNQIVWSKDQGAPKYKIEEIGDYTNNGPWEGTLEGNKNILVEAKNFIDPKKGTLEIDKRLLNPTPALENEVFNFKVTVTGRFGYGDGEIKTYSSKEPFVLNNVTIQGAGKWTSQEFKWYGDEPHYIVEENIPDNATYELVNGVISNGKSVLKNNTNIVATATNAPTTNKTIIEIDKKMVSETTPKPGEVFTAELIINGKFSYGGDDIKDREEKITVNLEQGNNWIWKSEEIVWNKDEVPTYTIQEVAMAEGTSFVSISDEVKTSKVNQFESKLNPEKTLITITNDRNDLIGKIKINKLVETEDLYGKTFNFRVTISGSFRYDRVQYRDYSFVVPVTVPEKDPNSDKIPVGEWESKVISWTAGTDAPTYTVEEIDLPEDSEFVSISNGGTPVTSSQSISGILNGAEGDPFDNNAKAGKVIVTCVNKGKSENRKQGHIVIIKESTDESIDDYVFFFKVTISGTFRYYNIVNPDGTIGYTQYTNETLVLDGKIDDVEAVCGGEDWISELITWDESDPNPTYTVEEISIPANIEFVSISNRTKTSESPKINGTILDGTENNYITAINKPGSTFLDGSIRIVKKSSEDLKGKIFYFDLKVTGEFDYAGKHYGSGSENGDTYILQNIEVEANGNPWVSGVFTWDEDKDAPKYEVKEVKIPEGAKFVSISNEKLVHSEDGWSGEKEAGIDYDSLEVSEIAGHLNLTKPVKIVAINYGNSQPNGSHIEITKEVLNESLKGTNFYFNVKVTSKSPFRYHDLEDVTKVTEYNANDVVEFKNVVAVADERDWVSGYFEWDEGASIPTYTISEITGVFPEKVKTVSIRNDKVINVEELDNKSNKDLVIEGSLVGDVTHIIAVNDADEETPVKGKIVIEKQALSPIIEGEEFTFTLTVEGKFKYQGKDYKKLEIKDIKITANGSKWESEEIEWYKKDGNPKYTVTEDTAIFADGTKFVSIRNMDGSSTQPAITGTVEPHFNNWIIAENTFDGTNKGRIQIKKVLLDEKGNQIDGVDFTFNVTVTFADGSKQEDQVTVTSGSFWRSGWYNWSKKDKAPTYHIEEVNASGYKCTFDNNKQDGQLLAQDTENGDSGIVSVIANNIYEEEHQAQIRVNKKLILNDKISKDDVSVNFSFLVKVTGSFTYKEKAYNDETLTLKVNISKDTKWTWLSDIIRWNGKEAPTFTVEEPESEIPSNWHLVSTEVSPSDNKLPDGGIAVVDVTNEWKPNEELILTMKLGGKVWDDTNRTTGKRIDTLENGIIDEGEPGISNTKVTIYRALVNKKDGKVIKRLDGVYAYDENNLVTRIENITYTDDNGNWSFGAVSVPAFTNEETESGEYGYFDESHKFISDYVVTYDVEFEYDGQTYEPTQFLATAKEEVKSYVGADATNNMYSDIVDRLATLINSSTSERDKFLYDSMAVDNLYDRRKFNNSFAQIQGKEVMDDYGNTVGATRAGKELNYTSVDTTSLFDSDNSRKVSTLKTINDEGEIYEDLRMDASTSNADLTFPFYTENTNNNVNAWHLKSWDKIVQDEFKIVYKFEAIYNYCLSINLGLVEREATDIAVEKDLAEALVIVNGKALKYKFNTAIDLEDPDYAELLYKQLAVADAQIEYKLGLYKGDYYYRAKIYNGTEAEIALKGFYENVLRLPVSSSEMEIYLKYTINVYNQSETYDVTVSELADYYDSSFKLVDKIESKYVETLNDHEVGEVVEVARPSTVDYYNGTTKIGSGEIIWESADSYVGSDNVNYNKMITKNLMSSDKDKELAAGEKATITVTFRIDKDAIGDSGVLNTIKLGKKHNVAEVMQFTSYYSKTSENRWCVPGDVSGRVDEDSAPDNVNIVNYNEKTYYEDDTDSAPIITIGLSDEQRSISGIVWDDAQTQDVGYGQKVGNGIYNQGEGDKLISGLTTEIFESIMIPTTDGNGEIVKDNDGEIIYQEYQFAWPTEEKMKVLGDKSLADLTGFHQATLTENGEYSFVNVPAGNYKVRYVYGDKEILTGNDGALEVYNGQDYKSTAYQIGFDNDKNNDGYVDNEWHDISDKKLADLRVNDARDNEARRLYISAKSEMLTHDNTNILATADSKDADHTELFGNYVKDNPITGDGYYMYAETAKINVGVENYYKLQNYNNDKISKEDINSVYGKSTRNGQDVGTSKFIYNINNIDCGLEERSQTKLTLDKQIKQITLMTSDNKVILDAIYDIDYTLKTDGSIQSTVTLNEAASTGLDHIASLNRSGRNQGYRYIIADGDILQGTQIQVKYQLTVFNMSETDRISKTLETLWTEMNNADSIERKNGLFETALGLISSNLYTENKGRICKVRIDNSDRFEEIGYGVLFGSVYYLGSQGVGVRPDEVIVKTKVHQMIDYIDPDVEFTDMNNISRDQSWSNTDINYLLSNNLIDPNMVQILDNEGRVTGDTYATRQALNNGERYSIISDKLQEYLTDSKNNLVLTIDNGDSVDTGSNPGFVKYLEPYMANKNIDNSTGAIALTVGRFYSSELDASDIDNLAEIIKFENTAGRRDSRNIAGNANPYKLESGNPIGIYATAQGREKDASATEVITLSPPTGLNANESRTMQLILVVLISVTLVAVSIVIIKKKVLIKK